MQFLGGPRKQVGNEFNSMCRNTTVAQGHKCTVVIYNNTVCASRKAWWWIWCEHYDPPLSQSPIFPISISTHFHPSDSKRTNGHSSEQALPSFASLSTVSTVHATAGPCYPLSSGVICQHDSGVKRDSGWRNKVFFVEYSMMKRFLQK